MEPELLAMLTEDEQAMWELAHAQHLRVDFCPEYTLCPAHTASYTDEILNEE